MHLAQSRSFSRLATKKTAKDITPNIREKNHGGQQKGPEIRKQLWARSLLRFHRGGAREKRDPVFPDHSNKLLATCLQASLCCNTAVFKKYQPAGADLKNRRKPQPEKKYYSGDMPVQPGQSFGFHVHSNFPLLSPFNEPQEHKWRVSHSVSPARRL